MDWIDIPKEIIHHVWIHILTLYVFITEVGPKIYTFWDWVAWIGRWVIPCIPWFFAIKIKYYDKEGRPIR